MTWLEGVPLETPAAELFAAVLIGVVVTRLFRHVLALVGLGS